MNITEKYSETKSIDEITNIAIEVWEYIQKEKVNSLNDIWAKYKDFCEPYFIVVSLMISGYFNSRVFRRYLKYISNKKCTSEDDFIDGSAYYMAGVQYGKQTKYYKDKCAKIIKEELTKQKQAIKNVEDEFDKLQQTLANDNKKDFKEYISLNSINLNKFDVLSNLQNTKKPIVPTNLQPLSFDVKFDDIIFS